MPSCELRWSNQWSYKVISHWKRLELEEPLTWSLYWMSTSHQPHRLTCFQVCASWPSWSITTVFAWESWYWEMPDALFRDTYAASAATHLKCKALKGRFWNCQHNIKGHKQHLLCHWYLVVYISRHQNLCTCLSAFSFFPFNILLLLFKLCYSDTHFCSCKSLQLQS